HSSRSSGPPLSCPNLAEGNASTAASPAAANRLILILLTPVWPVHAGRAALERKCGRSCSSSDHFPRGLVSEGIALLGRIRSGDNQISIQWHHSGRLSLPTLIGGSRRAESCCRHSNPTSG